MSNRPQIFAGSNRSLFPVHLMVKGWLMDQQIVLLHCHLETQAQRGSVLYRLLSHPGFSSHFSFSVGREKEQFFFQSFDVDHLKYLLNLIQYSFCFMFCFTSSLVVWNLSSLTRNWTHAPCIGRRSLNHWIARDVPRANFYVPSLEVVYLVSSYIPVTRIHC